ncbi:MAG TPA: exonuclease SbcCD subunit D [Chitinispirillaceae bacterium]|nr:exonuclease SbcCD subunit D [Chitinispirillaceae bacterium]
MKIIHTADWHLGRIFFETYLTDDQAYCLDQIVTYAKSFKPDVILITGDIYDRAVPPPEAIKLLDEILHQIVSEIKCHVIIIAGNHDSPERLSFGSRIFASQGIHIFGNISQIITPLVLNDTYGPVYFYPIAYTEPPKIRSIFEDDSVRSHHDALAAITRRIKEVHPDGFRSVLCAHASVLGGEISDSERPLSIGGAETVGTELFQQFSFTALGHLHRAQNIGKYISYAGSLMKYSFAEVSHAKSFSAITLDSVGLVQNERVALLPRHDLKILEGTLEEILSAPISDKYAYYMVSLTNKEPQLDAIGKLRNLYPNVLHIQRPELFKMNHTSNPSQDHRKLSEYDLFKTFYRETTGDQMNTEQINYLKNIITDIATEERETQ